MTPVCARVSVASRQAPGQTERVPQVVCSLRLRVWSLARKVVSQRAVRVRQQTLARQALRQLRPLAPAGADRSSAWTGPRLWN
jgi:hypothetical protein